jgi:hypothetical protein
MEDRMLQRTSKERNPLLQWLVPRGLNHRLLRISDSDEREGRVAYEEVSCQLSGLG